MNTHLVMKVYIACTVVLTFLAGVAEMSPPAGISQHLYCMGCKATVEQINKRVNRRRITPANRELKVMEIIENICDPQNFVSYQYSPPKSVKACKALLENHQDEFETVFVKDKPDKENLLCIEAIGACDGIDTKKQVNPADVSDIDLNKQKDENGHLNLKIDPATGRIKSEQDKKVEEQMKTEPAKKKKKSKKTKKKKAKKISSHTPNIKKIEIDIDDPDVMKTAEGLLNELRKYRAHKKEQAAKKDEL